jgi:hypothetical protein
LTIPANFSSILLSNLYEQRPMPLKENAMRGFLREESGNITIIFAVSLPGLALAAAFGVNHASLLRTQADLQNTADAAALAGARAMGDAAGESVEESEAAGETAATRFITSRLPNAAFSISPSASEAMVEVSLSTEEDLLFGGLLGATEKTVSAESASTYMVDQRSGCLIALDETDGIGIDMQGSAKVKAPNCGVWSNASGSNSIHMQGSPSLQGSEVCAEGAAGNAAGKIKPELTNDCGLAADPYVGRLNSVASICNYTNFAFDKKAKEATLDPGVYCGGLAVDGITLTLKPGIYVIKNGPLTMKGNTTVTGLGVALILTGKDAALDMQGSVEMSLTAMSSGDLEGLAISVTNTGEEANESELQGSPNLTIQGSVYMPGQLMKLQGSPQLTINGEQSKLVADSFSFHGSPDININADDTKGQVADVRFVRLLR